MLIELMKEKDAPWTKAHLICTLSSPIAGIFITRIILLAILKQKEKKIGFGKIFSMIFMCWSTESFEAILGENDTQTTEGNVDSQLTDDPNIYLEHTGQEY